MPGYSSSECIPANVSLKTPLVKYKKGEEPIAIVDLPGIYSLSPYSPEEIISRNYILEEKLFLLFYVSVILSRKIAHPLFLCEKKLFSYKNKWNIMEKVITKFIKCWEGEKKQR